MTFLATPATEPVPVLRWIYANGGGRFFCELSLDEDHRVYELRTAAVGAEPHPRVERFADVTPAFLRQGQLEAELIRAGWSLILRAAAADISLTVPRTRSGAQTRSGLKRSKDPTLRHPSGRV